MKKILAALLLFQTFHSYAQQQRKQGSPIDHLPANMEVLTHFGERADFSPDNREVAFMTKSFGDAMVIDLATRAIRCLTCGIPAAAFLRVMHLSTGDYILIGPEKFENIEISRTRDNELWFLSKEHGSRPVRLGVKMSEGMAISKKSLKIAYTQLHDQDPSLAPEASRLVMADIDLSGGTPAIINKTTIYESQDKSCSLEAQDFFDNDSKMTFICYEPEHLASVMTIDLATKEVVNQSKKPGSYNECEGILPGGKYTLVEGDRQCELYGGRRGPWNIDIYKLKLDGTGKDFVRLTHFNDYEGGKASNPVASTDGKYMAFQFANTKDPAGVGYGLLLYKFGEEEWTREKAEKWFKEKTWLNGLPLTPHASIDKLEFAKEYHAFKDRWDLAFQYLKNTRLDTLKAGRYALDGDNVYIIVTDGPTRDMDKAFFEAHQNYADIHYVISGREKIGVAPFGSAKLAKEYDPVKDIAFYTADGKYYEATPKDLFIFFAQRDAHKPGLKTEGTGSDKKIVLKIKTTP